MTMLTLNASPVLAKHHAPVARRSGLHQLVTAAVVNSQFREKLLCEPEIALANGYLGQAFLLTDHEKAIITTVRAKDLTDFAQKVNQALKTT